MKYKKGEELELFYKGYPTLAPKVKRFIDEAIEEEREKTLTWGHHEFDCILSQWSAGRPTKNGVYEMKFAGKWYQSRPIDKTPKCDCGYDDVSKE